MSLAFLIIIISFLTPNSCKNIIIWANDTSEHIITTIISWNHSRNYFIAFWHQ